jgi:hypothetical protein
MVLTVGEVSLQFSRNIGWMHPEEQAVLEKSVIAIAGAGGDGGALAETLVRSGVGEVRLADPDPFEVENLNRQACSTHDTVGINKAVAVGNYLQQINPNLTVKTYTEGVTPENIAEFVHGADLVVDETELTMHALGVMIAREAREQNVPDLMTLNVGFGSHTTTYVPHGWTLEQTLGIPRNMPLDEVKNEQVSLTRWLATLPRYSHLDTFLKVVSESEESANQLDIPTVAVGVQNAASIAGTQALLNLWRGRNRRPLPVQAKRVIVSDAMTMRTKVVKHPNLAIKYAQLRMVALSKLHKLPRTI